MESVDEALVSIAQRVADPVENALDPQTPAAAVSAVLRLHGRREAQRTYGDRRPVCRVCDDGRSVIAWPCATVKAVLDAFGVELPR